jgi:hypothetical protein
MVVLDATASSCWSAADADVGNSATSSWSAVISLLFS